jgi:hypothetical protein
MIAKEGPTSRQLAASISLLKVLIQQACGNSWDGAVKIALQTPQRSFFGLDAYISNDSPRL